MAITFKPDGKDIFLQLPREDGRRVLHRATLIGSSGDQHTLEPEAPLPLELNQGVFVYYERGRKFMQQVARVVEVPAPCGPSAIVVETTADPILSEGRECFRCPTVVEDISASIDDEQSCQVLDVSQTGFAITARLRLEIGMTPRASITYEGETITGKVAVQSVRQQGDKTRYGVRALEGDLARELPRVTMAVQRAQLRRASGAE